MPTAGTFSGGGLGMGVAFTLKDRFSQTADKIKRQQQMLSGSTSAMAKKVNASLNMMFSGAKMMAAGGALAAPFIIGINKSQEFNKEMSKVFAISRTEDEKTKKALTKTALELGTKTKFTATQAAEGMSFLAMAGFTANQQIEAMPGLLDLAAAGNTDLALTADIVSDTLTAMGMAASQTTQLADEMAATVTRSNTDITQMGEALKYSTAQADNLGVSSAELNGMIGMLGDIGIKGSMAGTGINQMLLRLVELPNAADKLKKLGIVREDLVDLNGDMKSMTEVLPLLANRFKDFGDVYGDVDKAALLKDVFEIRGAKAFAAFTKDTGKNYKDFVASIEGDSGAAARISEQMLDNFAGDLTKLSSIFDTTLINLGSSVENGLRPAAKGLTVIIELFNAFITSTVGKYIMQFTAIISGLLLVLGAFKLIIGGVTWVMLKLRTAIAATSTSMLVLYAAVAAIVGVFILIKNAMSAFSDATDEQIQTATGLYKIFLKLGGVFTGIKEILSSIDGNGQFDIGVETLAKLKSLGILGSVQTLGVLIGNLIGFAKGFGKGFSKAFGAIVKILKPIFIYVGKLIDRFSGLGSAVSDEGTRFSKFMKVGERLGGLIAGLITAFALWKVGVLLTSAAMFIFKVVLIAINVVMLAFQATVWLVNAALFVLTSPIGLVVIGILLLVAAVVGLIAYWDELLVWVATSDSVFAKFLRATIYPLIDGFTELAELWDRFTESDFGKGLGDFIDDMRAGISPGYAAELAAERAVERAGRVSKTDKNSATSTTNKVIDKTANANRPLVLRNTSEVTREVGDMSFNVMVDGTPLSSQFVKTQTRNTRRSE